MRAHLQSCFYLRRIIKDKHIWNVLYNRDRLVKEGTMIHGNGFFPDPNAREGHELPLARGAAMALRVTWMLQSQGGRLEPAILKIKTQPVPTTVMVADKGIMSMKLFHPQGAMLIWIRPAQVFWLL